MFKSLPLPLALAVLLGLGAVHHASAVAADPAAPSWPQFRGPTRDGIAHEAGIFAALGKDGPKQVWKAALGFGFSSVAIADGLAYASGNTKDTDTIFCFDAATGQEAWHQSYPCKLDPNSFEGGPCATPTVSGPAVYTLSRDGEVFCFDAKTGKVAWNKNLAKEAGAGRPQWGFSSSVLVEDNLAIINMGDSGVAFDKTSGQVAWKSAGGGAGYATPLLIGSGTKRALLIFASDSLKEVDPATGKVAWTFPWKTQFGVNSADPILIGDSVFLSSGYDYGCALVSLAGGEPKVVWQNKAMRNHFNTCVQLDGYIYGPDDSTFKCIEAKTGAEKWSQAGLGKGSLMAADGKLVILSEKGELVIAEASPAGYKEISRSQVLSGKCWTMPTLCAGRIYCRNAKGTLVCLALK